MESKLKSIKEKNMNSTYEMDVLRTIVSEAFKVEIVKKTNKREAVNARKIFSKILSDRGYTRSEIGRYLKKDHSSIVHYMYDVDNMIKHTDGMAEKYVHCKNAFGNVVTETIDEENKNIVSLKVRIDELLLDRERLNKKIEKYERIKNIIDMIDCRTPIGKEFLVYKKINFMFNGMIDYGEQPEERERPGGAYIF
jgi:hypothetical protein